MKKRLTVFVAVLVLLGMGVAVALGGSAGDPLVTKSYLEGIYQPTLTENLQKKVEEGSAASYDSAVSRLNKLGEETVSSAESHKSGLPPVSFQTGDSLDLRPGSSLLMYSGSCRVAAGDLADVTSGEGVSVGGFLQANHRYIVTSASTASVIVTQSGSLGSQGGTQKRVSSGELPFGDIRSQDWYYDAVSYVYIHGYFSGTSGDAFSPNMTMTRGMLATVLYRLSGVSGQSATSMFRDVDSAAWYATGVAWASENHIVEGMGGGLYLPDREVTREQIVTMLYRYRKDYLEKTVSGGGDLGAFPDGEQVSGWAKDAMRWAVGQGLITGRDGGRLDPAGNATRAEVATMMTRFAKSMM